MHWSRTYRSSATIFSASMDVVETRNGIRVIPDRARASWSEERRVSTFPDQQPADGLDQAPEAITVRYGYRTTNVVAMQLEYPR
jgi:hypothetical protein